MRKSSLSVTLGVTALMAASLTACGKDAPEEGTGSGFREVDADYAKVCRNRDGVRVRDEECDSTSGSHGGHGGHGWFFVPLMGGRQVAPVGSPVGTGSADAPAGNATVTRVSSDGGSYAKSGSVSRGGFGGGKGGSKGG